MDKGKFIVIEGLDGSGKATQFNLLIERLEKEGHQVEKIDFPRHGEASAFFADTYLNGKYGTAEEVGPYRGSIFYALDRYDASFNIRKWLAEGKIVVCDRYVASNIGHQGGKIDNSEEREKYLKWLYDLEYNIFEIPKPNINFILKTSAETSLKLSKGVPDEIKRERIRSYLGDREQDIHERDEKHLVNTLASYLKLAEEHPSEFKLIECLEDGRLLPIQIIHEKIWESIKEIL